eukprot:1997409-Pyramimonas_sp.AAC.1
MQCYYHGYRRWLKTEKHIFRAFFFTIEKAVPVCSEQRRARKELYEAPAVIWLTVYRRIPVRAQGGA